ncbi:flavin reductase family protein [Pseudomonas sp.]|uniref:flavin reductase family protein n=1 Tax=Pseudomonas sp. TaxID=306 RepID=UPI0013033588|nr:flavin reductase family protein [Pseudomonas sp.]
MPSPHCSAFDDALAAGHIVPVPLEKAYRLVNHGPTVLVSARHDGVDNVMAAAWACGLDFSPPKVTVVLDKIAATRALVIASGYFALQVPNVAQLQLTYDLGTTSLAEDAEKLAHAGAQLFDAPGHDVPLVQGCSAWLVCRRVPEAHIEEAYDLFVGEVVGAWANPQVFEDGHWRFDRAQPSLRSLHYIAGGQFYAIGESLTAEVK